MLRLNVNLWEFFEVFNVDRRKKVLPNFFAAKKAGKSAYFSRAEPDKLFIDGRLFSS